MSATTHELVAEERRTVGWLRRFIHRGIRLVTRHWPVLRGAAWTNRRLDHLFESRTRPVWLLAPARSGFPTMVLNVSINLQRKFFYFPKVYGRFYGGAAFAGYLAHKLSAGDRFIEIGANVGFFALRAAQLVGPAGRIYAFEPEPDIFEALVRSAHANGYTQLEAFQLALSDREDEVAFYRARDGTASSLVPEAPGKERRYERTLRTRMTSLDKLVDEGRLELVRIALVKIDVEGAEVQTVAGMLGSLATAGYPSIWCEVRGPAGSTRAPDTYRGVHALLAPLGYRPFRWVDGARVAVTEAEIVERTDVLFERDPPPA
jgi:FkbM family methyltransferase